MSSDDVTTSTTSSNNSDVTMEDVDKISNMVTSSCETSSPSHSASSPMETEVSSTSDNEDTTVPAATR